MHLYILGFNPQQLQWLTENAPIYGYTFSEVKDFDLKNNPSLNISELFLDPISFNEFIKLRTHSQFLFPSKVDIPMLEQALKKIMSTDKQPASFMPPELVARYRESIYEKIILFHELQKKYDRESLKTFKDEVHKIAGSAGSFGFPEMTLLAREMERKLTAIIERSESIKSEDVMADLRQFEESLKLSFQNLLPIFASR